MQAQMRLGKAPQSSSASSTSRFLQQSLVTPRIVSQRVTVPLRLAIASSPTASAQCEATMAAEYNKTMQQQMQWGDPYEYHPQRGLYWNEIVPGLICGTQPRSSQDVQTLCDEGVTHILNLQTDKDMQHWGVDIKELENRCRELGVTHIRRSARDFDPLSLRKTLPSAVSSVGHALAGQGKVYVHCTAGLGRAPAVCIAYMFWFLNMDLDVAYKTLTDIRPCGPKRDAIRGATFDLMSGTPADAFERLCADAWASLSEEDRYALQWRVLRAHQ